MLFLLEQLFKVATTCDVVLCCRVAPLQKAGIVALIKNRTDDMTLAIGDGNVANLRIHFKLIEDINSLLCANLVYDSRCK